VDALDQAKDIGSHDEEVASGAGTGIPVGVGRSTRNEHARSGWGLHVLIANLHTQGAFENVPGFVVGVVEVARSDQEWRTGWAAGVSPLGDDEGVVGQA